MQRRLHTCFLIFQYAIELKFLISLLPRRKRNSQPSVLQNSNRNGFEKISSGSLADSMWNLLKSSQEMQNIFSPENFKFHFRNNCRGIKYWRKGWNATFITLSFSLPRDNIHYYYFPFTTILKLFIERKIANGVKNVSTCNFKILFK